MVGAALGAGARAIRVKLTHIGIYDQFLKDLGETFRPNPSALLVLIRVAKPDKVLEGLKGFNGKVLQTSLTKDKEEELRQVLED